MIVVDTCPQLKRKVETVPNQNHIGQWEWAKSQRLHSKPLLFLFNNKISYSLVSISNMGLFTFAEDQLVLTITVLNEFICGKWKRERYPNYH